MSVGKFKSRALNEQVIVITCASNGVGLETAKIAASRGAKVILGAKNRDEIDDLLDEINQAGGTAIAVTTDVSKLEDLINLKNKCLQKFGRIDTWINSSGSSIYGYLLDSDMDQEKKIFETNFWGARYGSQVGVLAMQDNGGVLINLGSEVSVAAQPLLGIYSATKEALKTFTDALRLELRDKDIPVEVCLVRPTNFEAHFEETALAIIKCAENPQRDVYVGGPARLSAILDTFFPQVKDMVTESKFKELKVSDHTDSDKDQLSTLDVLKTLKDNLKSSLKDMRKHDGH